MTEGRHVTLQEAAARLGVHYQTVYRWVRQGVLPAVKVAGSYAVEVAAIESLAESRRQPVPPPLRRDVRDWAAYSRRLHAHLVTGDELAARAVLDDLSRAGISLRDICDRVMVPALVRLGNDWMEDRLGIAHEHRASAICERALGRLGFSPPGRPRGTCVVCSSPSDEHHLPVEMATAALREDHWQVHHLGTGVPAGQIVDLAGDVGAELVVISVTWPPAQADAEALAARVEGTGRRVLVGGPGHDLAELVAAAREVVAGAADGEA